MKPETLKILNSLRSDVSDAIFHNLDALNSGDEFVPVPTFSRPKREAASLPAAPLPDDSLENFRAAKAAREEAAKDKPPALSFEPSIESVRAANNARAKIAREKKRAAKIAAGWIPPEQREVKSNPERLAYFRQKQAEYRAAKKTA